MPYNCDDNRSANVNNDHSNASRQIDTILTGSGHASDPASLLDALGGESLPEKERRLSEKIMELQKLRDHLFSQHNDFCDRVRLARTHSTSFRMLINYSPDNNHRFMMIT